MAQSEDRAVLLGQYIVKNKATVREAAAWSGISKSTVHSDVTKKLSRIDSGLYKEVRKVLDENKAERHMRGGMATKEKWEKKAAECCKG
ncbi:MAG: sporulation transcriptional regulator SpoIIID [Acutalibacteraceae bacterium]|nr:sporulation transcriptional regulator SpoIIID [Oscillospiraceae bacterium]